MNKEGVCEKPFFTLPPPDLCDDEEESDLTKDICARLQSDNILPDANRMYSISVLFGQLIRLKPPVQPIQPPDMEPFDPSRCKLLSELCDGNMESNRIKSTERFTEKYIRASKQKQRDGDNVAQNIAQLLDLVTPDSIQQQLEQSSTCTENT